MPRNRFPRRAESFRPRAESLEARDTPSAVTVTANELVRTLNDGVFGVNINSYDSVLAASHGSTTDTTPDPGTVNLLTAAGINTVRISNGSGTDDWHFADEASLSFTTGVGAMANVASSVGAGATVTVDYGNGTPQEAAAYLAYLNGAADNATVIGVDTNGKDWGTAGSWAALRGSAPLAVDDGLNHLRASHPAPYGFRNFEVGNEVYFGQYTGGTPITFSTPAVVSKALATMYVSFASKFAGYAAQIDPNARIGLDVGNPVEYDDIWNKPVLAASKAAGFTPGFLSDHFYVFDGANDGSGETPLTDDQLLTQTISDPNSVMPIHGNAPRNFATRAADYRALLESELGAPAAANVELIVGEFNSDSRASTKQTTALTNGLLMADALGSLTQTEYTSATVWNLRNHYTDPPAVPDAAGISGWRTGSDNGIVGAGDNDSPPATGPYVPYPAYFGVQLASMLGKTGDLVVSAKTDTATVSAYSVLRADGHVSLLLINKSAIAADTAAVSIAGFVPDSTANLWRYGQTEDDAQRDSKDGAAAITHATPHVVVVPSGTGGTFSVDLPAYSMTLLDLAPAPPPPPAGIFGPPTTVTDANLGPQTTVLAVADFNEDTVPDVAVTNAGSANPNTISVLPGKGDGTFDPAVAIPLTSAAVAGRFPEGVVAVDYDGDGHADLAVVLNEGSKNNVVLLHNDPANLGTFTFDQMLTAGANATHIVASDFNGDHVPDLAVSNFGGGVSIFLNDGKGVFPSSGTTRSTGGTGCNVVVAADFNGDKALDLAVANQNDGTVGILLNDGKGGFTLETDLKAAELGTTFLAVGDLNGDGNADLVASNTFFQGTGTAGSTVSVFSGKGDGSFAPAVNVTVGTTPTGVVVHDFTGDGLSDVAVGVESTGKVVVLRNDGHGGLLAPVDYAAVAGVNGLAVGDFNGDKQPDLIVSQYTTGDNLAVLPNRLVPTATTVSGPATATEGDSVTFTVTVDAPPGPPPSSGVVAFYDGTTPLGIVPVAGGVAQQTLTTLLPGDHTIRAVYADSPESITFWTSAGTANITVARAPIIPSLDNTTVPEFRPVGTAVGTLGAEPFLGHSYTYGLVPGTGADDNALFRIVGNQLVTAGVFNADAKTTYTVRVRAVDESQNFGEKTFTITVADDPSAALGGRVFYVLGSTGDDEFDFTAVPSAPQLTFLRNGTPLAVDAAAVDAVVFNGFGGADRAQLYASGPGVVIGLSPRNGNLKGSGYKIWVNGVATILVHADAGGTAYLAGSSGDDNLAADPTSATLAGGGFANTVAGFDAVVAFSNGGKDAAYLAGSSGQDTFAGTPTYAVLTGAGFYNLASGFRYVTAYASGDGDVAYLADSFGNDTFVGTPSYSAMAGAAHSNTVSGFQYISASASAGNDAAYLVDSPGDDTLGAGGSTAELDGPLPSGTGGFIISASGFDGVVAYGLNGGTNKKKVGATSFVLETPGDWTV